MASRNQTTWWTVVSFVAVATGIAGYLWSHHQPHPAPTGYPVLVPQNSGPEQPASVGGYWTWPADEHGAESYWQLSQDGGRLTGVYRWNTATDVKQVEGTISPSGAIVLREVGPNAEARFEGQLASDGVIRGTEALGAKRLVWTLRPGSIPGAVYSAPTPGVPAAAEEPSAEPDTALGGEPDTASDEPGE